MADRPTTRLRKMFESDKPVVAPFVFNALHAKIAEAAGFPAVYMTGFGVAAERGYPDVGLITQTEMIEAAEYVTRAVDVPVIADCDTGYGNPINTMRSVREYERAGVAAIHLEDQVFPKRDILFAGKELVPMEEHARKIRAALDARTDKDFIIIARTDALSVSGWEEAARRARAYREVGADMILVDGVIKKEDVEVYARELSDMPLMFAAIPSHSNVKDVEPLGFKLIITGDTLGVLYPALKAAMEELRDTGNVEVPLVRSEVGNLLGLKEINEQEAQYGWKRPTD